MKNYICAIKSPFSKYQRFVYVDHKNRVAPGLMKKRGIKEYINRIADINNTNYLLIDCNVESQDICSFVEMLEELKGVMANGRHNDYQATYEFILSTMRDMMNKSRNK